MPLGGLMHQFPSGKSVPLFPRRRAIASLRGPSRKSSSKTMTSLPTARSTNDGATSPPRAKPASPTNYSGGRQASRCEAFASGESYAGDEDSSPACASGESYVSSTTPAYSATYSPATTYPPATDYGSSWASPPSAAAKFLPARLRAAIPMRRNSFLSAAPASAAASMWYG